MGSDADIVIWDPNKQVRIGLDTTHSATDYCVYEGRNVRGYPVVTVSRGEVVYKDGVVDARPGRGQFLKRGEPIKSK